MSFVLHNAPQSTCSQKVRICLHEKRLAFSEVRLDLFKGDQLTPEYKALNPNGVVPTLVHDGQPIVDSSVIIEYLDELQPAPSLRPDTALGCAKMREWMRFFEEVPTPAIRVPSYNLVFLKLFRNMTDDEFIAFGESKPLRKDFFLRMGRSGYPDEDMQQAENRLLLSVTRMAEALVDGRSYLLGDYSLADICILPSFVRMHDIGLARLWSGKQEITNWFERCLQRPAIREAFYPGSLLSEQYPDAFAATVAED